MKSDSLSHISTLFKKESPNSVSAQWKSSVAENYKLNKLLDICSCTCFVNAQKSEIKLEFCRCENALKIPIEEIEFYSDQKYDRKMQITS